MTPSIQVTNRPVHPEIEQQLVSQGINPFMARLWASRGVTDITQTEVSWKHLLAPSLLTQVEKGARILADAIEQGKQLLIVADYDCDGATACAVGMRGLRMLGAKVDFMVPNRFETGYGLSPAVIDVVLARNAVKPDMIITVDNGIASVDGVAAAKKQGIEVLVTDHHLPGDQLPDAIAIINPNQKDCNFPSKNLAGVGVIFYTLMALRAELRARGHYQQHPEPRLDKLADLVALGTVADVVKLDSNNRILVTQGLARIRSGQMHSGIQALFDVAGTDPRQANSMDLGFKIGPRINAAGRLADMSIGIRCLISDDYDEALSLAQQLDEWNHTRRSIEQEMSNQALIEIESENFSLKHSICVFHPEWHQGVVGIVASRLKEKFWKPTLAFAPGDDGEIRGSGRSVPDVHLRDALDLVSKQHPDLIHKFGGHAMAAGLTISAKDFERFSKAFDQAVVDISGKTVFAPVIETDGSLNIEYATAETAITLSQYVWGAGFPSPIFRDIFQVRSQRLLKEKHLKLQVMREGMVFDAIWFNHPEELPDTVELVYEFVPNYWNGNVYTQLMIKHAIVA
ncbi:single-stranded-DNA-specific exonuclease RecJ [Pelistega europaea]|uniref:Single-stranded-DNA-specific exonuclease RecJ n=1 Tax=Pelistega europaea TaxID=106147 RepID=A0A7Y4LB30_9BURK|nr:single-stranded-DNA-specific exonuclease RecJ [Pelistega europaea]NOL50305.1 single-stranded-DNA-specific exonuclease RecJ [Pelistega europaea]